MRQAIAQVETAMNLGLGSLDKPLLVSVRSGAAVSMPGMMDTVLNLGLNDQTVQGLIKRSGDERFGWDSYRRFISLSESIVLDIDRTFSITPWNLKKERNVNTIRKLTTADLQKLVEVYKTYNPDNR